MHRPGRMLEMSGLSIQSHMELNGNREAVVEGCGGVLEYDEMVLWAKDRVCCLRLCWRRRARC